MSQIYGMESPIDTTQLHTVWGSHVSMFKWGPLTLAQLQLLSFSNSTHDTKCIEITKAGFCEF